VFRRCDIGLGWSVGLYNIVKADSELGYNAELAKSVDDDSEANTVEGEVPDAYNLAT